MICMAIWNWNRKRIVTLTLASAILTVLPSFAMAQDSSLETSQVRSILSEQHVSGVNITDLQGKSIDEMIKQLQDPYTVFFSADQLHQFENSLENQLVGMGVRVGVDEGGLYIMDIFAGSPAEKAGIQPDDYIEAINGVSVHGEALDKVTSKIKGEAGTSVQIRVLRGDKLLTFPIVRDAINVSEINSKRFEGNIGYIQVTDFSSDADEQFTKQLKELKSKGLNSLIIDLRNNPGGLLETALNISKNFIKEGTLIHTRDRNNQDAPIAISGGSTLDIPVYILLNEYSASASEVLAGALQDYGVAKVIGVQSYGKGSVQQVYQLQDGGALKVTVEEYLTPKKRKVNKFGITPDIKADGDAAQLITALKKVGVPDIKIEITKHRVFINSIEVNDSFPLIKEDGHLYAPTRALAALIGADITWNNELRAVELTSAGSKHSFPVEAGKLLIVNGTSFVNLDQFDSVFTQLQVATQGEKITIQATKGK
jgi:carboxyl-terminal processing protease